jgi:hypothetical protein
MKFSLRLDYDNPEHDKIITELDNLDKKRHKTKTRFVINALTHYIDYLNLVDGEELLKARMSNLEEFVVTRKEFESQISVIRAELKAELYEDIVSMVGKVGAVNAVGNGGSDAVFNGQEESSLDTDLSKYAGIMDSVMSWSEE